MPVKTWRRHETPEGLQTLLGPHGRWLLAQGETLVLDVEAGVLFHAWDAKLALMIAEERAEARYFIGPAGAYILDPSGRGETSPLRRPEAAPERGPWVV